jgi:outer membrane protein TolC
MFVDDSSQLSLPLTYYDITSNDSGGFDINNPVPEIKFMDVDIHTEYQHMGQLTITRPLYTFGAQEDASSIARSGLDVARLDTELGRLTLIANVKKSFYLVILTENVVRLQRESVARAEEHLFEVQELYNSGLGTRLDLLRSQTGVQSANEQLTTAITNNTLALRALNFLLGYEYRDQISVSSEDEFKEIDIMPLENYISIALTSRTELQQIDSYLEIAGLQTGLSRDRPVVAFAGIWNFDSRGSLFVSPGSWRAMVTCEIPVFDNGLSQSRVDQARIQEQDLELKKTDLINGIKIQTESAYLRLTEVKERLVTSESILQAAEEGYRIATISYIENVATELDVMDAAHGLTGAGINLAQAQYDYEVALADLALACALACGLPEIE